MEQGYGQWEYRVAVVKATQGILDTVDGSVGPLCFDTGSSEPMSLVHALDVWGALGWDLVGMASVAPDRLQYVLKRPRHQGGWEGARIHMRSQGE